MSILTRKRVREVPFPPPHGPLPSGSHSPAHPRCFLDRRRQSQTRHLRRHAPGVELCYDRYRDLEYELPSSLSAQHHPPVSRSVDPFSEVLKGQKDRHKVQVEYGNIVELQEAITARNEATKDSSEKEGA